MKTNFLLLSLISILFFACKNNTTQVQNEDVIEESEADITPWTLSVEALESNPNIPGVQSGCWARNGNKMLVISGRIEGFHGLIDIDTIFKSSKANDHIFVIDFDNLTYSSLQLNPADPNYLQFTSSNAQFCQVGDLLYIAGGYGRASVSDYQSNTTIDRMVTINVPQMISIIENGGDPQAAVTNTISSPYLQVCGGEMFYENETFYIAFGQNYPTVYSAGITGNYTNAVRSFKITGNTVTDTSSNVQDFLHRRDLNVVKVISAPDLPLYAGYGGVFTSDDNGFENPVYIYPNGSGTSTFVNTELSQITNQYNCAVASVYNSFLNVNVHYLIGGIGRYQWNEQDQQWEDGDNGALLPFVKTIGQMIWNGNELSIKNQTAPNYPELPQLMGSNAIFFPLSQYLYEDDVLDLQKFNSNTQMVGYLFGGISSQKATSSAIYPSKINNKIYKVILSSQS